MTAIIDAFHWFTTTFPTLSMVIRVPGVIVPFSVVLKLSLVPCAASVQFSAAITNIPPLPVPLKFVAP